MDNIVYKTGQREFLIEYLKNNTDRYVSVEDIEKFLYKKQKKIGLTTIYRFLNKLEGEGKLRVETKNHTKYYQLILDGCQNHFHLKCAKCGKVIHFECEEFNNMINHIQKEHEFFIDSKFVINGLCTECKKIEEEKI